MVRSAPGQPTSTLQRLRLFPAELFAAVLGLAYLWTGSEHGVLVQPWAAWLLYTVLVDLTDTVAARLNQPGAALSLEMVYRGLYHCTSAFQRRTATDVVDYLAANATRLGRLMRKRARAPSHLSSSRPCQERSDRNL